MLKKKICLFLISALCFGGDPGFAAEPAKVDSSAPSTTEAAIKRFDSGDRAGAFLLLKNLEKSGDVRILSRLGWCYFSGTGVEENKLTAYQYFNRSISDPDGFGIDGMGMCYHQGIGVNKDPKKGEELQKKALAMGNLYAAGNLAIYYGNIGNTAEAIRYWEMGYKSNLPPFWKAFSAFMLGTMHKDPKQKILLWEEAAKGGFHDALLELTKLYNFGDNVEINMPKALEYAKIYSERTGETAPYAAVAFDWGIEKMALHEWKTAEKYMLIAADNGDKRAYWYAFELSGDGKYALAAAESGDERGFAEAGVYLMNSRKDDPKTVEKNWQRAVNYYKAAIALQDNNSLNAVCNLAASFAEKRDAENLDKALVLYLDAARWQFPRGLRGTGLMYAVFSQTKGTDEEKKKYALLAMEYVAAAAFLGDKIAEKHYSMLSAFADQYSDSAEAKLFKGVKLIIEADAKAELKPEALKLIKTAAEAGCVQAIMLQGMALEKEHKAAAKYLSKAAAAGNLHAKWLLASERQFAAIIPEAGRLKYLKDLIAAGNKKSRHLYVQILDRQGKTAEAVKECRAAVAEGHAASMTLLHILLTRQKDEKAMAESFSLLVQAIEKNEGLAQCLAGINSFDNPDSSSRFGMHLLMKGVLDGDGVSHYYQHRIALNFAKGIGVAKSAENAKRIAGIMLEEGDAYGFYTMGQLYQIGAFGKVDTAKARESYQKGAAQGVQECIDALKALASSK